MTTEATKSKPERRYSDWLIRNAQRAKLAATLAMRSCAGHTKPGRSAWECAIDAAELKGLAKRIDRYNENRCNREVTEREQAAALRNVNRVLAITAEYGAKPYIGGDPRGPAVRVYWPDMIPAGSDPGTFSDRMLVVEVD